MKLQDAINRTKQAIKNEIDNTDAKGRQWNTHDIFSYIYDYGDVLTKAEYSMFEDYGINIPLDREIMIEFYTKIRFRQIDIRHIREEI